MRAKFIRGEDPKKSLDIGLSPEMIWAKEMVAALQKHRVTQFGGSIPIEDIEIQYPVEGNPSMDGAADVTASVQANPTVKFNLYFSLRDHRDWNSKEPKWIAEISISSPAKKGFFSVKATGKNTSPEKLLQKLSEVFDLKFRRR